MDIKELKENTIFKRNIENFEIKSAEQENRIVEISFASEIPYERYFGMEIIDMDTIDLSRLNSGGMLLFNHDRDNYIGVVERAWVGSDRRAYARVRFDTHEQAEKCYNSVLNKILTQVSFEYSIKSYVLVKDEEGMKTYRVSVTCNEVSFCTIAADPTVGYCRSLEENDEKNKDIISIKQDEIIENKEVLKDNLDNGMKNLQNGKINFTERKNMDMNEIEMMKSINSLGRQYGELEMAAEFIEKGKTKEEFLNAIIEKKSSSPSQITDEQKAFEKGEYNLDEIFHSLHLGKKSKQAESLSREFEEMFGYQRSSSNSIYLPLAALREGAVTTGGAVTTNPASAGNLINQYLWQNPIAALGDKNILSQLGMQVHNNLDGIVHIPRHNDDWEAEDLAENATAEGSELNIDYIELKAKVGGINIPVSRSMLKQTRYPLANYITTRLRDALAKKMQSDLFSRLENLVGVGSVAGNDLTWAKVTELESAVLSKNALNGKGVYLTNSSVKGLMKSTQRAAGLGFIAEGNTTNGYEVLETNALRESAGLSSLYFLDGSTIHCGLFGGIEIQVNPNSPANGERVFAGFVDYDFAFERSQSIAKSKIQTGTI